MSPVLSLSRRASPNSSVITDENASPASNGRSSRASHRSSHSGKEHKCTSLASHTGISRRGASEMAQRKRAPLANTTNTSNNRAVSGKHNYESAEDNTQVKLKGMQQQQQQPSPSSNVLATGWDDIPLPVVSQDSISPPREGKVEAVTDATQPSIDGPAIPDSVATPSDRKTSPRRSKDLFIDVDAANGLVPQSREAHASSTSSLEATPNNDSNSSKAPSPPAQEHQQSGDGPATVQHDGHRPSLSVEHSLVNYAVVAVLQEQFGVSDLKQLPVEQAQALLDGQLATMVAQYIQQIAQTDSRTVQRSTATRHVEDDRTPTPPLILSPPPFPADALPSEIQLEQNTNLYLSGLSETMTDDQLLRLGMQYGDVISHKAIINSETGQCKGYGFVMYAKAKDAAVAMVELQRQGFLTSFARHESFSAKLRSMADVRSTNVYVSNLPLDLDDRQLAELVQPHTIVSRRILSKPDGTSRGVGFIRFQTREIAQDCIDRLHGKRLPSHPHPLQARFADSETQKRLKQDTTLRKVYADLDMGRLHAPMRGARTTMSGDQTGNLDQPLAPVSLSAPRSQDVGDFGGFSGSYAPTSGALPGSSRPSVWPPLSTAGLPIWTNGLLPAGAHWSGGSLPASASSSRHASPEFASQSWNGSQTGGMSASSSGSSLNTLSNGSSGLSPQLLRSPPDSHSLFAQIDHERRQSMWAPTGTMYQSQLQPQGLGIGDVSYEQQPLRGVGREVRQPDMLGSTTDGRGLSLDAGKLRRQVQGALGQQQQQQQQHHLLSGIYGQQNLIGSRGGQPPKGVGMETLAGRDALLASGFVRASDQKAAIPIVDPATRHVRDDALAAAAAASRLQDYQGPNEVRAATMWPFGAVDRARFSHSSDNRMQRGSTQLGGSGMTSSASLGGLSSRLQYAGDGANAYRSSYMPSSQSFPSRLSALGRGTSEALEGDLNRRGHGARHGPAA